MRLARHQPREKQKQRAVLLVRPDLCKCLFVVCICFRVSELMSEDGQVDIALVGHPSLRGTRCVFTVDWVLVRVRGFRPILEVVCACCAYIRGKLVAL